MGVFQYNAGFFGGTEYMARGWHKHILLEVPKFNNYLSLIIPGKTPSIDEIFNSDKQIILWMHNTIDQFDEDKVSIFRSPEFINKIKYIVVPSENHKIAITLNIEIVPEKVYVIPNAIDPLYYNPEKFKNIDNIKLINTSNLERGMDILLYSIPLIKHDISVGIYNDFYPDIYPDFFADKRITFYGKTPKETVRKALESSHIHSYPSTYIETFCLSQIEAMSAGLACVTSNLGALPEVSGGFGKMYDFTEDKLQHINRFVSTINNTIEEIHDGKFDPSEQIEYVNKTYSWKAIKDKWLEFHELI